MRVLPNSPPKVYVFFSSFLVAARNMGWLVLENWGGSDAVEAPKSPPSFFSGAKSPPVGGLFPNNPPGVGPNSPPAGVFSFF